MTDMVTPGIMPSPSKNFLVVSLALQAFTMASLPGDNIVKGIFLPPHSKDPIDNGYHSYVFILALISLVVNEENYADIYVCYGRISQADTFKSFKSFLLNFYNSIMKSLLLSVKMTLPLNKEVVLMSDIVDRETKICLLYKGGRSS
jgi:hypothetical protein